MACRLLSGEHMRLAIASLVSLAACASSAPSLVPSHPQVARYSASVDDTRTAVREVLASHWLHVDAVGEDSFATGPECRTDRGGPCPTRANAFTTPGTHQEQVMTYKLKVAARVVPSNDGVLVNLAATLTSQTPGGQSYELGKGEVPAWLQRDVDSVQREISHQLAPMRPNG